MCRLAQARSTGFLGPQVAKWEELRKSTNGDEDDEAAALRAAFTVPSLGKEGNDPVASRGTEEDRRLTLFEPSWSEEEQDDGGFQQRSRLSTLHEIDEEEERAEYFEEEEGIRKESVAAAGTGSSSRVSWHNNAIAGPVSMEGGHNSLVQEEQEEEDNVGLEFERRTPLRRMDSVVESASQGGRGDEYAHDDVSHSVLQGSPPQDHYRIGAQQRGNSFRPPPPVETTDREHDDDIDAEAELSARVRAWQLRKSAVWDDNESEEEGTIATRKPANWQLGVVKQQAEPFTPTNQLKYNSLHSNALFQRPN